MSVNVAMLEAMKAEGLTLDQCIRILRANGPDTAAEKRRAYDRERKRELAQGGFSEARAEMFSAGVVVCSYCGDREGPFHADHIIPLSRGGSSDTTNLAVACAACNLSKGAQTPEEWRQ